MKTIFILLSMLLCLTAWASSYDLADRFGIALGAGAPIPFSHNEFDNRADGDFNFGLYGVYHVNDESGYQFGFTRYEWNNSPTAARVYDVMYTHRPKSERRFTSVWGGGVGVVDIANYNVDEDLKLGLRIRGGFEYGVSPDMILAAVVDYQFVGKMPGERNDLAIGEMHFLAPQLVLSYFFPK